MPKSPLAQALCALVALAASQGQIVINEIGAVDSGRQLRWDADDQPFAGAGPAWWAPEFDDVLWETGATPIGYGLNPITTNLSAQLSGVSPSIYTRKAFTASGAEVASGGTLILRINYNDGFIVWINGKELARSNMGAAKAHIYHDQVAYRADSGGAATEDFNLGTASSLLVEGENVVAIQVANEDVGTSLRLDFSLLIDEPAGADTELVAAGSTVRYLPGLIEPVADPFEPALLDDPALANETSDWIELHNAGGTAIDIGGWRLTDDAAIPAKWVFPAGSSIDAGGYLLVLADSPISPIAGAVYPHANFKLGAGGDYLGLYNDAGAVQSEIAPSYSKQHPFHSYGITPGGSEYVYLGDPTPGAANAGSTFAAKADAPDFDNKGGFYDTAVTVTLTSQTPGASIRYTTDGTEPTLTNGSAYQAPLVLNTISNKKGHVIRARSFLTGLIPSNTKTHTFLIGQDPKLRSAPALVFSANLPRSLYDPFGALALNGGQHVSSRWQPTAATDYNNVINRGRAYERPIHSEFYFADGTPGFRTDCGARVAASSYSRPRMKLANLAASPWPSSGVEKPSFNLYFRDEYGNPDVDLPLNGENAPVDTYRRLRVRAGKNDIKNPFIIDELTRRLSHDMGQPASRGVINTLYINGELKGFYNMVERLREPFFQSLHSDNPNAQWDILQHEGTDPGQNVAEGDMVAWVEMIARLSAATTTVNWESVLEVADVENMADYYLLNIYTATWDWPQNNWVGAKERSAAGRWRLYVWDAEGAMGNKGNKSVSHNVIASDLEGSTQRELHDLWDGLNRWEEFRLLFADRINKHLFNGGVLDDRDYESSVLKARHDELVGEFSDLLSFVNGENVKSTIASAWASPTSGRRRYLLGPTREDFYNNDLWPATTPPDLSQFGGSVPEGYALELYNETGDIYYTTDGSDPRLSGGTANPDATSQPGSKLDVQLVPAGATWSYSDTDGDLGTAWRTSTYDHSTWDSGAAPLGYGTINDGTTPIPISTTINPKDPDTNLRQITVYLRRTFDVADASAYLDLRMSIMSDGGAAVYINGIEAFRDSNVPLGATFDTTSNNDASDQNEGDYDRYEIAPSLLVTGTNTIAVELHNATRNSSDMVMDMLLEGTRTNPESLPVIIDRPLTVMARSYNNGEWSALTTADFTVDTIPASSANLAVTELLYNPSGASAAEQTAGFTDGDQFEFLQVKNIGTQAIDLHGVRFSDGIGFDFSSSDIRALAPGGVAIIVSDLAAFRERHGSAYDAVIAGDYTGRLNNGGEQIRLIDASGATLQEFAYSPLSPWPDLSAHDGHSIQIINPGGEHDDGTNWIASSAGGGNPQGSLSFASFLSSYFDAAELADTSISGPAADTDGDGLNTFIEFALGTPPDSADNGIPHPVASVQQVGGTGYLTLEFTVAAGERDAEISVEVSGDLSTWAATPHLVSTTDNPDGSTAYRYRDTEPVDTAVPTRFIRLKASG